MILRDVVNDGIAAMMCVWTGYFLRHDYTTASKPKAAMLIIAALAGVAGIISAHRMKSRNLMIASGALAVVLTALAYPYAVVPAVILVAAAWLKSQRSVETSPGESMLLQFIIAIAALAMGLTAVTPEMGIQASAMEYLLAIPLAVYIAIVEIPRVAKALTVPQIKLLIWLTAIVSFAGAFAALSLDVRYGIMTGAMLAYLAIRVIMFGWFAVKKNTSDELRMFAQNLIAGTGLLAGGLLAAQIQEGTKSIAELTWPIVVAFTSVVWIRLSPYLMKLRD